VEVDATILRAGLLILGHEPVTDLATIVLRRFRRPAPSPHLSRSLIASVRGLRRTTADPSRSRSRHQRPPPSPWEKRGPPVIRHEVAAARCAPLPVAPLCFGKAADLVLSADHPNRIWFPERERIDPARRPVPAGVTVAVADGHRCTGDLELHCAAEAGSSQCQALVHRAILHLRSVHPRYTVSAVHD
jgi:hypothetical protein